MNQTEKSEKKVLQFYIGYLFACIPFFVEGGKYKALNCITIGDGYLGATTGEAMVIVEKDIFKGCDYLLSGESIKQLYDFILSLPDPTDITDFELRIENDSLATAVINEGDFHFPIELCPYQRMNLKKADIEKPKTKHLEYSEMPHFDPSLLHLFIGAGSLYTGINIPYMRILPTGLKTAIYIEMMAGMHGVLMPAFVDSNVFYALNQEMPS